MKLYRNMNKKFLLVLWALVILLVASCGENRSKSDIIFASIAPHAILLSEIAGEAFTIETMVGSGQSPTIYSPTPKQIGKLESSSLYFAAGVPYEQRLTESIRNNMPDLPIVDLNKNIELISINTTHGDHEHAGGLDPHTWLDPILFGKQALIVKEALVSIKPENESIYVANYDTLIKKLKSLDSLIKTNIKLENRTMLVFHPTFGYFAERYGVRQMAIETDGKEPTGRILSELIEQAEIHGVKQVIAQPQFSNKSASVIAETIGASLVTVDPLPSTYEDYKENLLKLSLIFGEEN